VQSKWGLESSVKDVIRCGPFMRVSHQIGYKIV